MLRLTRITRLYHCDRNITVVNTTSGELDLDVDVASLSSVGLTVDFHLDSLLPTRLLSGTESMDDINGTLVPMEEITFRSKTDSLLAALALERGITVSAMNSVLATLLDPSFDVTEISLTSMQAIYSHIAETRHQSSLHRSAKGNIPRSFPQVILELILDLIAEKRDECLAINREKYSRRNHFTVPTVSERELTSMMLVCRAWSWPAQRALGRTLCLNDPSLTTFKKSLTSPLFGLWTRQIIILQPEPDGNAWDQPEFMAADGNISDELSDTIELLLLRFRGLRKFCLNTRVVQPYTVTMLRNLKSLAHLRELRVMQGGKTLDSFLGLLCEAVAHMPCLQYLAIEHYGYAHDQNRECNLQLQIFETLKQMRPPSSLTGLSLRIGPASDAVARWLAWLSRTHPNNSSSLSIHIALSPPSFTGQIDTSALLSCMDALGSRLELVEELSFEMNDLRAQVVSRALGHCLSLRRLQIRCHASLRVVLMNAILAAEMRFKLGELAIFSALDFERARGETDALLQRFLMEPSCSVLRKLTCQDYGQLYDDERTPQELQPPTLPLTYKTCDARGIELRVFGYNSFLS